MYQGEILKRQVDELPDGAGARGVLIWCPQGFPVGPTGTSWMA